MNREMLLKAMDIVTYEIGSCEGRVNALNLAKYDVIYTSKASLEERIDRLKDLKNLLLEMISSDE